MVTYDFLLFGVFCLLVLGYLVWDRAHRDPEEFKLQHPIYELKRKDIGELSEVPEDRDQSQIHSVED
jgi:hypothetical protein